MPGTFTVDLAATFQGAVLVSASPKLKFGSSDQQETNAQGIPKWTAEVAVTFTPNGVGVPAQSELITITITAPSSPFDGLHPGTPVTFDGFRVGFTPPELHNNRVRGGKPWYTAAGIRAAIPARSRNTESAG